LDGGRNFDPLEAKKQKSPKDFHGCRITEKKTKEVDEEEKTKKQGSQQQILSPGLGFSDSPPSHSSPAHLHLSIERSPERKRGIESP